MASLSPVTFGIRLEIITHSVPTWRLRLLTALAKVLRVSTVLRPVAESGEPWAAHSDILRDEPLYRPVVHTPADDPRYAEYAARAAREAGKTHGHNFIASICRSMLRDAHLDPANHDRLIYRFCDRVYNGTPAVGMIAQTFERYFNACALEELRWKSL